MAAAATALVFALGLSASLSCSSSKGGLRATFEPAARVPAAAQVYLDAVEVFDDTVSLAVRVRDLADIEASDAILVYDPDRLVYFAFASGTLMEQIVGPVTYDVDEQVPGVLRMQISRTGSVDAGLNDPVLVVIRFKVVASGDTPATFASNSALEDDQGAALPGVTFYAGAFSGSRSGGGSGY